MKHLRIIDCASGLIAYYDGRVPDYRFMPEPNWVDNGAISLGIASYALISDRQALVYDTHVSVEHARFIRTDLEKRGVKHITVLLSHWHLDHVAGTAAFSDCEIISNAKTLAHLKARLDDIQNGSFVGPPAIMPLILPNRIFEQELDFKLGNMKLKFIEANIHSDDATLIWRSADGLLLAGDTMEDTVTYVGAPQDFDIHLRELEKLWRLNPEFIFPNHGTPDIISVGGYGKGLIKAQSQYIRVLKRCQNDEGLRKTPLKELISGPLEMGWINYFAPYEEVHAQNLERVLTLLN